MDKGNKNIEHNALKDTEHNAIHIVSTTKIIPMMHAVCTGQNIQYNTVL